MNIKTFCYTIIMQHIENFRVMMLSDGTNSSHAYDDLKSSGFRLSECGMIADIRYDVDSEHDESFLLVRVTNDSNELLRCLISYDGDSLLPAHMEFMSENYNSSVIEAFDEYFSAISVGGVI